MAMAKCIMVGSLQTLGPIPQHGTVSLWLLTVVEEHLYESVSVHSQVIHNGAEEWTRLVTLNSTSSRRIYVQTCHTTAGQYDDSLRAHTGVPSAKTDHKAVTP
jgi:hypothetical protein